MQHIFYALGILVCLDYFGLLDKWWAWVILALIVTLKGLVQLSFKKGGVRPQNYPLDSGLSSPLPSIDIEKLQKEAEAVFKSKF